MTRNVLPLADQERALVKQVCAEYFCWQVVGMKVMTFHVRIDAPEQYSRSERIVVRREMDIDHPIRRLVSVAKEIRLFGGGAFLRRLACEPPGESESWKRNLRNALVSQGSRWCLDARAELVDGMERFWLSIQGHGVTPILRIESAKFLSQMDHIMRKTEFFGALEGFWSGPGAVARKWLRKNSSCDSDVFVVHTQVDRLHVHGGDETISEIARTALHICPDRLDKLTDMVCRRQETGLGRTFLPPDGVSVQEHARSMAIQDGLWRLERK